VSSPEHAAKEMDASAAIADKERRFDTIGASTLSKCAVVYDMTPVSSTFRITVT
jgi:hypothetical protein